MTAAQITANDKIIFNDIREVGFVKSLKPSGHEVSASASRDCKAVFYTTMDKAFADRRHVFDGPVYISHTPSDHQVNPDFVRFVERVIA